MTHYNDWRAEYPNRNEYKNMKQTLLQKAKAMSRRQLNGHVSKDEKELIVTYLKNEVGQVAMLKALGLNPRDNSHTYRICCRVVRQMVQDGEITFKLK